jgi:hypothetical protein
VYVEKKSHRLTDDQKPNQRLSELLAESESAIRGGNNQYAYELSLQATQVAPESVDAWLLRATLAASLEERVLCVNRLNELAPNFQDRYHVAFYALKELLEKNPFLAYLEETDELYRVINAERMVLSIPKRRAAVNSFPSEQAPARPLQKAYHWLTMSILGLLLAGIGTVLFAPLAALAAVRAQKSVQSEAERVNSTVVLIVASVLFMIGFLFSLLFILHWLG